MQIEDSVIPKTRAIKAEQPESSPFLDWARSQRTSTRAVDRSKQTATSGVCTRSMQLRRHFLQSLEEEDSEAAHEEQGAKRAGTGHHAVPSFAYATPAHLRWGSDLHSGSRSIQEQVNVSIAAAKHLRVAEALIRPICRVPV